jgi:hypothetical protein
MTSSISCIFACLRRKAIRRRKLKVAEILGVEITWVLSGVYVKQVSRSTYRIAATILFITYAAFRKNFIRLTPVNILGLGDQRRRLFILVHNRSFGHFASQRLRTKFALLVAGRGPERNRHRYSGSAKMRSLGSVVFLAQATPYGRATAACHHHG